VIVATDAPPNRVALRFMGIGLFFDKGVAEAKLKPSAVAVWAAMWRHAAPDGRVFVAIERLSEATNLSERGVKYALAELKAKRMLKTLKKGGPGRGASVYAMSPIPMPTKAKPEAAGET
jgi:hypothetical protein